jgi:hypothetical protein
MKLIEVDVVEGLVLMQLGDADFAAAKLRPSRTRGLYYLALMTFV